MKNVFYFINQNVLFVLEILKFLYFWLHLIPLSPRSLLQRMIEDKS